jgi:hypothetical protein
MPLARTFREPVPRFKTGARVRFRLANRVVRGKIVEYRGPLAMGRPLYRVEVASYGHYELPEEELKPA